MGTENRETMFQEWLQWHLGIVLNTVRTFARTPHDQEDLFQEILVNLWSSLPRFRGEAQPSTWIYRVSFNTALCWQRGERKRGLQHRRFVEWAQTTRLDSGVDDHEKKQARIDRLYEVIRALPHLDASLALMYLDGLSYLEMSQVLGISENYVGVKLNRIRRELSDQLQGETDES